MIRKTFTENGAVRGAPAADPRDHGIQRNPVRCKPPVGENRWRAPQPARNWEGTLDCLEFAPISMQAIPGLDRENIYSREWNVDPEIRDVGGLPLSKCLDARRLPLRSGSRCFVWFFGGGLQVGNPGGDGVRRRAHRAARHRGRDRQLPAERLRVSDASRNRWRKHRTRPRTSETSTSNSAYSLDEAQHRRTSAGTRIYITIGGQSAGGGSVLAQLNCERKTRGIHSARDHRQRHHDERPISRSCATKPLADAAAEGREPSSRSWASRHSPRRAL